MAVHSVAMAKPVSELSLLEIVEMLERPSTSPLELDVLDPDHGHGRYAGERVVLDGREYVHRPWRTWVELAERLGLRLRTPRAVAGTPLVRLTFDRLARTRTSPVADETEKYGLASEFARTTKLEDPGFVIDFAEALGRVTLPAEPRILALGVNTGDELALLLALRPALERAELVGVDHCASALERARERFPRARLVAADLDQPLPALGRFDLVIAIAVLQSAALDDRELLRRIVQQHLTPGGAVIIGVPNCRHVDGETEYGARMKNFRQPELGLLVKDVAFYRKYLQQHHRQVFVTGKHHVLVTAVP